MRGHHTLTPSISFFFTKRKYLHLFFCLVMLHLPLPCVGFLFLPLDPCFVNPSSTLIPSVASFSLSFPRQVTKCTNLNHLFSFYWSIVDLQCVPISAVQQSDSVWHIRTFFFQDSFPLWFIPGDGYSSLCSTVGPCCLSILNVIVCLYQPQINHPFKNMPSALPPPETMILFPL